MLINYLLQLVSQDVNSWEIQLCFIVNDILLVIQVDLDRLIQVLLNFYFNVIQVIGQYGVISVMVSESGVGVKISVIDSGKGIVVGQFEVIFILYFIIKVEGIGLGLVVVYNIVEQYGGIIQVVSQEGKGVMFIFCFLVNIMCKDL